MSKPVRSAKKKRQPAKPVPVVTIKPDQRIGKVVERNPDRPVVRPS
jgi:hypothetical protein